MSKNSSLSRKRDSNSQLLRPKRSALPIELFLDITCGGRWTRTTEPLGADLQSAAIATMRYPQNDRFFPH